MKKKILILGAGFYYINVLKEIRKLGYEIYAVDRDINAPGAEYADCFEPIDITDRVKVLEFARRNNIDGIMPINDFGVRTACYVATKLNIPGNTLGTGIAANDKGIMRDIWKSENLNQPLYIIVPATVKAIDLSLYGMNYPVVVKPTDCGGAGRGISVATNKQELQEAIKLAIPFVKNDRIIIEEYIEGTELTVDALCYKGKVHFLSISDKVKAKQKYRVATSLNFPAKLPDEVIATVKSLVEHAILSLGITNGAAHTEVIVDKDNNPKLVELGARGGGGHVFHSIVNENCGVNYPQEFAKILCGDEPDLKRKKNSGVVYRFFNPPEGKIKEIKILSEINKHQSVIDFSITAKPGQIFEGLKNSMYRVGYVVTRGETREDAIRYADLVEENVKFVMS